MHLGLIGFGNITRTVLAHLPHDPARRITVLVRPGTEARSRARHATDPTLPPITFTADPAAFLSARPELCVECAGHSAVRDLVPAALRAGIDTLVVSLGALADPALQGDLRAAAGDGQARLILPSGAIGGLDLLAALTLAGDVAVTYRGTKPPAAWAGTPAEAACDLDALTAPAVVFTGTAREAARDFPKNANVVAALALAGAGFDATRVELIADPSGQANRHSYAVASPICRYDIDIENLAAPGNAKTSLTTAFSVLHEIIAFAERGRASA